MERKTGPGSAGVWCGETTGPSCKALVPFSYWGLREWSFVYYDLAPRTHSLELPTFWKLWPVSRQAVQFNPSSSCQEGRQCCCPPELLHSGLCTPVQQPRLGDKGIPAPLTEQQGGTALTHLWLKASSPSQVFVQTGEKKEKTYRVLAPQKGRGDIQSTAQEGGVVVGCASCPMFTTLCVGVG